MTKPEKLYLETKKQKFLRSEPGVINRRLINIDINHVIPNKLHLLLRITDRLIENLISSATLYDYKVNKTPTSRMLNGPMLTCLIREIKSYGVTFNISCRSPDNHKFTSLTGVDRKKLLRLLPAKLKDCQPPTYCKVHLNPLFVYPMPRSEAHSLSGIKQSSIILHDGLLEDFCDGGLIKSSNFM